MKFSKIGLTLVGLYLILTLGLWIYASSCNEMYCGLVVIISVFPWVFLLESIMDDSIFSYILCVGLNIILIYSLGLGLSKIWGIIGVKYHSK